MGAGNELLKQAYQETASVCEGQVDVEEVRTLVQMEKNPSLFRQNVEMAIEWAHLGGD